MPCRPQTPPGQPPIPYLGMERAFLYLFDLITNLELTFVPVWPYAHSRLKEYVVSLFDLVVGKPLATSEERAEHIGPIAGIPVFGLDALSSAVPTAARRRR